MTDVRTEVWSSSRTLSVPEVRREICLQWTAGPTQRGDLEHAERERDGEWRGEGERETEYL